MTSAEKYDIIIDDELAALIQQAERAPLAENYSLLAKAYNIRGMFRSALHAAQKATQLDEEHFSGWFEYAIAATIHGETTLREILKQIEAMIADDKGNLGEMKTAKALTHYYLSEDNVAKSIAQEAIDGDTRLSHSYEVLGYISYNTNDSKQSIRHFLEAVKVDANNFRAHWMIGHCWFELDDLKAARDSYSRAVTIQPYFANAWFSLGKVFLVMDDIQNAYQCFYKCLSINPRMWDCYFTQADYYLGHRNYENAIASCKRILELIPDDGVLAETYNYIGEVYLASHDFISAQHYFELAAKTSQGDAVIYNNLGVTLLKQEHVDEAIAKFERAIELDPNFAYPITKLGHAFIFKRQFDKALEMFNRSLQADPNEYWAWLGISEVHRRNRQYRKELEAVMKAAEIAQDDSDVYNYMGIAFQSLRDYENSEKAYLRSLELDPFNRKAANNLGFLYERFLEKTDNELFREKAIGAWKQRLLICRDTNASTRGAISHLTKLGVEENTIEQWLAEGEVAEFTKRLNVIW
jgi:tetratricopeptide (TPR) repeat protein